jgi:hypothetical protein
MAEACDFMIERGAQLWRLQLDGQAPWPPMECSGVFCHHTSQIFEGSII